MDDRWRGRPVLVTGAAGFVGAHLTQRLADLGADVRGVDLVNESPARRAIASQCPMYIRDLREPDRVRWFLDCGDGEGEWRSPEVVFHLAGQSHIRTCHENPLLAWDGARMAWNVFDACRHTPAVRAVVAASSNHVYGASTATWNESAYPQQTDAYGAGKFLIDILARSYGKSYGLPVATLRHVNCFGPGDPHASHLVTGTILSLLRGERPVIQGTGDSRKGYLHVGDVVGAYLLLAEALVGGPAESGEPWNAGAPPISVLALVRSLVALSGLELEPTVLGEDRSQSGYVEHLNSDRLSGLGWSPHPLEDGLRQTWTWYRARS